MVDHVGNNNMIKGVDEGFWFDEPCFCNKEVRREGKLLEARIQGRERGKGRHSLL